MNKIENYFFIKFFLVYIKMVNKYYQVNKEKLWKKACKRNQNLSEKEKVKNVRTIVN